MTLVEFLRKKGILSPNATQWTMTWSDGRAEMSIIDLMEEWKSLEDWINVKDVLPSIGEEYNVIWDLDDGEKPVVSTMEFDFITKKWLDTRADGTECKTVLFWQPLPKIPDGLLELQK